MKNKANAKSNTHSQFATANATPKIVKKYVFANADKQEKNKVLKTNPKQMSQHPLRTQIEEIVTLSDAEFDRVLGHFQEKTFKKHQIVLHQGDYASFDFFVVKGLMRVSRVDPDGKEHILQFGMENWWITDAEAFHHQTKSTLTVDCLEDTKTLSLTLENKEKLSKEMPKMQTFFLKKTTNGYIALQKRILCFLSSNANDRYHNLLSLYPGLMQRVPKAMIASYLGVTRETLSRLTKVES
ncbi:Crp/Fnr family transcriptional regulator [Zunongwangia profunda]|uniref:Crp/Fnr family transcriptional regulator n=1 Tax=Zunongwangia profunda TaxID=398743 RepID=UPI001D18288C|nr:Crp/Fnr family transcriptional regulator [Zunongwangia profunda]MCC4227166.1 Crp/Fnr family transcriptional regulator [Zunongwangia profunda]